MGIRRWRTGRCSRFIQRLPATGRKVAQGNAARQCGTEGVATPGTIRPDPLSRISILQTEPGIMQWLHHLDDAAEVIVVEFVLDIPGGGVKTGGLGRRVDHGAAAADGAFKVSYRVQEAGWSPFYDARMTLPAKGEAAKLNLVRRW